MGKLQCGCAFEVDFDDRLLAHLQAVIGDKLRRGESFFLTWHDEVGGGISTVWLERGAPLAFRDRGGGVTDLNDEWVSILAESADSPQGLRVTEEPRSS
jgi:hypothetical protein